jgi:predicted dehydrogenase
VTRLRRRIRVAVVGLGYWGPNLLRNFNEVPEAVVTCVCDRRAQTFEKIHRRYPAIRCRTSYERVLADPKLDAVAIATPVATHYALASAALEAGKHVFVEKPLAASYEEAEQLVEIARRRGLTLMCGHTFLYSPPVNAIKALIDEGELGEIYFISMSRVNLGIHQADVSVVWDLGPHDFSILRYWLGENPEHVAAVSRGCIIADKPDVAFINLGYRSGTLVHAELSWLAPSKLRRTTVVGSRRMIVYDDGSPEPVRVYDSGVSFREPESFGEYKLSYRTGTITSPPIEAREPLLLELADFCAAVQGRSRPRSTPELGLDVVQAIEAVDRSLGLGGRRIFLARSREEGAALARDLTARVAGAADGGVSAPGLRGGGAPFS